MTLSEWQQSTGKWLEDYKEFVYYLYLGQESNNDIDININSIYETCDILKILIGLQEIITSYRNCHDTWNLNLSCLDEDFDYLEDAYRRMLPKSILSELHYAVQPLTALKDHVCLLDRKKNTVKYEKLALEEGLNKIRETMKDELDKIRKDIDDELELFKKEN